MRNIELYGNEYINNNPFEDIQVMYRRKKILEILAQEKITGERTILEIGCGLEPLFLFYPHYTKYVVVEPCDVFFRNAQSLVSEKGIKHIDLYHDFFENKEIQLSKYEFDYILCSSLLHEVESPEIILKSIFNLCTKDKTVVHINVPNMKSFHRLLAKESGLIKDEHDKSQNNIVKQQHTNFDMTILVEMVKKTGFDIIESGSYFIKPFTHAQMKELMDINILTPEILDGLYNMEKYMPDLGSEIFVNVMRKK